MTRRSLPLAVLLAVIGSLVVGVTPAHAHEGAGILVVEALEATGSGANVTVRLTWSDDGHPASDATVTVTAVDDGGRALTPVPLEEIDDDGRYAAEVPLPATGTWTLRVTSVEPTASIEEVYVHEATPTTPPAEPTTTTTGATTSTGSPPTSTLEAAAGDRGGDAGGGSSAAIPLLAVAGIALAGIVAAVVLRARSNG